MANTYTQINIHAVFAVKYRSNVITPLFRERLYEYIAGIIRSEGHFPLAVGGYSDHVHVFFELNPSISVSKAIQVIKSKSSKWINQNNFVSGRFSWQSGYGAFTYSRSQRHNVIQYIMNQEAHHGKTTFREEYLELLDKFEIEFENEYVFEFYDG